MDPAHPTWQLAADQQLAQRVTAHLNDRNSRGVWVEAQRGAITLRGEVRTAFERKLAVHHASQIEGVLRLDDQLRVAPAETFDDPCSLKRAATGGVPLHRSRQTHLILGAGVLFALGSAALFAIALSGPSRAEVFPVQGLLTVDDQPPVGALVVFHPVPDRTDLPRTTGKVGPDGGFRLSTYGIGDGAPEGEYIVTLHWQQTRVKGHQIHTRTLLPAYESPHGSPLRTTIAAGTNRPVLRIAQANAVAAH